MCLEPLTTTESILKSLFDQVPLSSKVFLFEFYSVSHDTLFPYPTLHNV